MNTVDNNTALVANVISLDKLLPKDRKEYENINNK